MPFSATTAPSPLPQKPQLHTSSITIALTITSPAIIVPWFDLIFCFLKDVASFPTQQFFCIITIMIEQEGRGIMQ
jgi:hypothetical protein